MSPSKEEPMHRLAATAALAAFALACTTNVLAASTSTLHARQHRQLATLHADRGALRFCANHPLAHTFCTPHQLRFSRARIAWTTRELKETIAALNPWRVPSWFRAQAMCIYGHENGGYGWHANTGNGYQTGMQFAPSTWVRGGGTIDSSGHYYYASPAETIYRAWIITRHGATWSEWSTRGYCGL
jgi:hypothetical protein